MTKSLFLLFATRFRRLVTNSSDRTLRQFILPSYTDYANVTPPSTTDSNHQPQFLDLELEPTHRFNDPINKTSWHAMCYSPDGEWLAGGKHTLFHTRILRSFIYYKLGAADPAGHKIYIWDISNDGQFASALDGGREPLVHLHVNHLICCIFLTSAN